MSGEHYEIYEEPTWIIHDPWNGQDIATFHNKDRAEKYLAALNKTTTPQYCIRCGIPHNEESECGRGNRPA